MIFSHLLFLCCTVFLNSQNRTASVRIFWVTSFLLLQNVREKNQAASAFSRLSSAQCIESIWPKYIAVFAPKYILAKQTSTRKKREIQRKISLNLHVSVLVSLYKSFLYLIMVFLQCYFDGKNHELWWNCIQLRKKTKKPLQTITIFAYLHWR